MQYFRKHDTDNNHQLDGLELLKALARMDGKYFSLSYPLPDYLKEDDHHGDGGHPGHDGDVMPVFDIKEIIPIVDTILREDDKVVENIIIQVLNYNSSEQGWLHQLGRVYIQAEECNLICVARK